MDSMDVVTDEPQQENTADISTLVTEEDLGLADNGDGYEFDLREAATLRKKLVDDFDRQVGGTGPSKDSRKRARDKNEIGNVKSKISAFEKKQTESKTDASTSETVSSSASLSRPPIVPLAKPKQWMKWKNSQPALSVFLRIRPPVAPTTAPCDLTDEPSANTVEILSPGGPLKPEDGCPFPTTIRTYPPENSNASKVVRPHAPLPPGEVSNDSTLEEGGCQGIKEFDFKRVFGPTTSQEELYEGVAANLVKGMFPSGGSIGQGAPKIGQSALLFSYGITNAGKTFTIMGKDHSLNMKTNPSSQKPTDWGIIPRALSDIFQQMKEIGGFVHTYKLAMSYFEIYNEQIFDLLPALKTASSRFASTATSTSVPAHNLVPLKLRESRDGKIFVRGLTKHKVKSVKHGLELAARAKNKRHTSSNSINHDSSRSHCICQLELICCGGDDAADFESVETASGYSTDDEAAKMRKLEKHTATMWIVDLAGSERTKRTGSVTKSARQREAAQINASLMKLMRCMQTLRDNQRAPNNPQCVVPFRESKLTHLFMNHLSGPAASRTSMIVNVNPSAADFDETQHVLAYATIAKTVRISDSDYNSKRRAIAMAAAQHTHDSNGRSLAKQEREHQALTKKSDPPGASEKSPPKKRLDRKLSPKRAAGLSKETAQAKQLGIPSLPNNRGAAVLKGDKRHKPAPRPGGVKLGTASVEKNEKLCSQAAEISELRMALAESNKQLLQAQKETQDLREALVRRETEVRMELADEMEAQMNSMRDQYNDIFERLKAQSKTLPTPGRSARKIQLEKAEKNIGELLDKVDECEEEMTRMRMSHEEELEALRFSHAEALELKTEELAAKNAELAQVRGDNAENENESVIQLESELRTLRARNKELEAEVETLTAEGKDLQLLESEIMAPHKLTPGNVSFGDSADKENGHFDHLAKSAPRRLGRRDPAGLLPAEDANPDENRRPHTVGKKMGKGLQRLKVVFKDLLQDENVVSTGSSGLKDQEGKEAWDENEGVNPVGDPVFQSTVEAL